MAEVFAWLAQVEPKGKVRLLNRRAQFGDGYSQATGDGINAKAQSWDVEFRGNAAQIADIKAFLDAHGGWKSFLWSPPLEPQGLYRCEEYTAVDRGANRYLLSATFVFTAKP